MTKRTRRIKIPKLRLTSKVSFVRPFGFEMTPLSLITLRNRQVVGSAKRTMGGWIPTVILRSTDTDPTPIMAGWRGYSARTSAETAAKLFIQYVQEQLYRKREPLREEQLKFPFVFPEQSLAA